MSRPGMTMVNPRLGAAAVLMLILTACLPSMPRNSAPSGAMVPVLADSPVLGPRFIARGNEPFWTITVNAGDLTWVTPEDLHGKRLLARQRFHAEGTRLVGEDGDEAFSLVITRAACTDTMSGQAAEFSVVWVIAGKVHSGCADRMD